MKPVCLLADAMVWNYVAKAGCLGRFLESLRVTAKILPLVAGQLEKAVSSWPELSSVLQAIKAKQIECYELSDEEHVLLMRLLDQHPGLGEADCALLAVASTQGWPLVTCDVALKKVARRLKIECIELTDVLDRALRSGSLTEADTQWVMYYSQGGQERRNR